MEENKNVIETEEVVENKKGSKKMKWIVGGAIALAIGGIALLTRKGNSEEPEVVNEPVEVDYTETQSNVIELENN